MSEMSWQEAKEELCRYENELETRYCTIDAVSIVLARVEELERDLEFEQELRGVYQQEYQQQIAEITALESRLAAADEMEAGANILANGMEELLPWSAAGLRVFTAAYAASKESDHA